MATNSPSTNVLQHANSQNPNKRAMQNNEAARVISFPPGIIEAGRPRKGRRFEIVQYLWANINMTYTKLYQSCCFSRLPSSRTARQERRGAGCEKWRGQNDTGKAPKGADSAGFRQKGEVCPLYEGIYAWSSFVEEAFAASHCCRHECEIARVLTKPEYTVTVHVYFRTEMPGFHCL